MMAAVDAAVSSFETLRMKNISPRDAAINPASC
jgi:hypothetical protein